MEINRESFGRVDIAVGEHVISASCEGEIIISKIRDRDFVCHSDNVGHLILCFSALLEYSERKAAA